jgi:hypothetical protein
VQGHLEHDPAAATESAGEDRAVVGEHPGRIAGWAAWKRT